MKVAIDDIVDEGQSYRFKIFTGGVVFPFLCRCGIAQFAPQVQLVIDTQFSHVIMCRLAGFGIGRGCCACDA